MAGQRTNRLKPMDAAFLNVEQPNTPMHVGSLAIHEGSIPFERHVEYLDARIPMVPPFRQRLASVPFHLAHQTLEDDSAFDIRNHVQHHELEAPGTDEQFLALVGKIFERPLERDRPLWELHLINGLAGGRSAALTKIHHCLIDGASGMALLMGPLTATGPEGASKPDPVPWHPRPFPSAWTRFTAGLWAAIKELGRMLRSLGKSLLNPVAMVRRTRHVVGTYLKTSPWLRRRRPDMPFSGTLGPKRRVAFVRTPFEAMSEIRSAQGGTVNDVGLAIVTGALRSYLRAHDHNVSGPEPQIALAVNVRGGAEVTAYGNQIAGIITPVPVGIDDPIERFREVRARQDTLKREDQAVVTDFVARLLGFLPAPLLAGGGPLQNATRVFNMPFSNGGRIPIAPLYSLTGHKLEEIYALMPLPGEGASLGIALLTYDREAFWGIVADPDLVPDLHAFKCMFEQSHAELLEAARATRQEVADAAGS